MRDAILTALSVGGSEIAALVGLDPNRDAFAIYAEKLGLVEREPPTARMRMGKKLERIIADVYAEETGNKVLWHDVTMRHTQRTWQAFTVDAFIYAPTELELPPEPPIGLLDSKNVSWDQYPLWGEAGTDEVPDRIACQIQYYLDATGLPWGDVAALFGGNDLRIYRIEYDANIADVLRGAAEEFVRKHLEPQVPPPIGHSDTAARYLKQKFPRNVAQIREASPDEVQVLYRYKSERAVFEEARNRKESTENEVRALIGDADGVKDPVLGKITWKRTKDTIGVDWEALAKTLYADLTHAEGVDYGDSYPPLKDYEELHKRVLREGARRLVVPRTWKAEGEDEE